jgi:hypothetical protein
MANASSVANRLVASVRRFEKPGRQAGASSVSRTNIDPTRDRAHGCREIGCEQKPSESFTAPAGKCHKPGTRNG